MSKPALYWRKYSVNEKVIVTNAILASLDNNIHFPNPNPSLSAIKTALEELKNAQIELAENGGGKKFTHIRDNKEKVLAKLMSRLKLYVEFAAEEDTEKIVSSGFKLTDKRQKKGKLPAPDNLSATTGNSDGIINLKWWPVKGAVSYKIYMSDELVPRVWTSFPGNTVTKSKHEVTDLPGGARKWFRVVAINSAGESSPCDPAVARVP